MEKTKVPNASFIMPDFKRMPYEPSKRGMDGRQKLLCCSQAKKEFGYDSSLTTDLGSNII